jgi:hypothetical protein
MTIRDQLKKKKLRAYTFAVVFWLLVAVAQMFFPQGFAYRVLVVAALLVCGVFAIYMFYLVRCPKCGARLLQAMQNNPAACPNCGVSLGGGIGLTTHSSGRRSTACASYRHCGAGAAKFRR